jgi:hypothetical protein
MKQSNPDEGVVLRWHISRIYEDDPHADAESRTVDVVVQPGSAHLSEQLQQSGIAALHGTDIEKLSWWDDQEGQELEGSVDEAVLIQAVRERNVLVSADDPLVTGAQRQLTEDMVLVQELPERHLWDQALEYLQVSTGQANLNELAVVPGSRWLDLTRQARSTAKMLYSRALGEATSDI